MAIKRRFGEKKGTAKPKGAKGQSYKKKDKNKIKTKAKTVNRNISKRQQRVAMAKSMRSNLDIDRKHPLRLCLMLSLCPKYKNKKGKTYN